ncbi:MAG TPA: hypothetical protein VFD36_09830 [Kofleriaceae bacterium]|jgi:hypothetical protein|nr:hypothetical protein [Kofleriaceae bacterium]
MESRAIETTDLEQIPDLALSSVTGGISFTPIRRASEWVTAKFAQLFSKNVDEITPAPRNKDFIDNAIRRPAEPPASGGPRQGGLRADNDNIPLD